MCGRLALWSLAGALALAGCATPGVLKKPLAAPTMARPSQADPLPAYATPDPITGGAAADEPSAHGPAPGDRPGPS
ncbi:MAG: hypothetical protein ACR2F8_02040 [Caulobacteraceae bacterium]